MGVSVRRGAGANTNRGTRHAAVPVLLRACAEQKAGLERGAHQRAAGDPEEAKVHRVVGPLLERSGSGKRSTAKCLEEGARY